MWRDNSLVVLVALVPLLAVAACGSGNGNVTAGQGDANTVNGSISVPAGVHSGALDTVNGSIHLADSAVVGAATTVNGTINLGAHAAADSVSTVNGSVSLDDGAHVAHEVAAVNGSMNLKSGADVGGSVRNVNGHIVLTGAHVAGSLRTVDGDIDVNGESRVDGGIIVEKANSSWFSWTSRKPRIVIGPGAVIRGNLRFDRPVELYVSDKAAVGPISGANPIRFSGDKPPG